MNEEITVKIDLENYKYMDYKITESFIKNSIAEAVKDYFFTDEFNQPVMSAPG